MKKIIWVLILLIGIVGCTPESDLSAASLNSNEKVAVEIDETHDSENGDDETVEEVTEENSVIEETDETIDEQQCEEDEDIDELIIYTDIGSSSNVIGAVDIKNIDDINFTNVFEIINNELQGWYSGKLEDHKTVYFNRVVMDDEIPIYSNISGDLHTDNIKFITGVGVVEVEVGMEASYIKVKSLFEKNGYFAILDRYEEAKWTLINSQSGEIYNFTGDVVLSPYSPCFVVPNPYGIYEGNNNSISVYSLVSNELKCEWMFEGVDWRAEDVLWENENMISYSEVYYGNDYKVDKKIDKIIRFDGIEWKSELKSN